MSALPHSIADRRRGERLAFLGASEESTHPSLSSIVGDALRSPGNQEHGSSFSIAKRHGRLISFLYRPLRRPYGAGSGAHSRRGRIGAAKAKICDAERRMILVYEFDWA
jgi:hypothetical protein